MTSPEWAEAINAAHKLVAKSLGTALEEAARELLRVTVEAARKEGR